LSDSPTEKTSTVFSSPKEPTSSASAASSDQLDVSLERLEGEWAYEEWAKDNLPVDDNVLPFRPVPQDQQRGRSIDDITGAEWNELAARERSKAAHPAGKGRPADTWHPKTWTVPAELAQVIDLDLYASRRRQLDEIDEPTPFEMAVLQTFDELTDVLLAKHRDYGPHNIGRSPGGPLNGIRVRLFDKLARIDNLVDTGAEPEHESLRGTSDEPAAVVTSKVDRNKVRLVAAGITGAGRPVPAGAPAPTITGKGTAYWLADEGQWRGQGSPVKFAATNVRPNTALRGTGEPAPTLAFGHERPQWVSERPATTVAGDSRIGQPGHKHMGDCHPDQPRTKQFDTGSVRVTVEEASLLQSFPPGYPWQGTKTKQYQQVGNAVPPGLAAAVLAQVATSRQDALETAA
jgi:hypothetical protein